MGSPVINNRAQYVQLCLSACRLKCKGEVLKLVAIYTWRIKILNFDTNQYTEFTAFMLVIVLKQVQSQRYAEYDERVGLVRLTDSLD